MGKWRRMKIVAYFKNGTERVEEFAKMNDFLEALELLLPFLEKRQYVQHR